MTTLALQIPHYQQLPKTLVRILNDRTKAIKQTVRYILKHYSNKKQPKVFFDLMSSFIHMLINRLCISNARYQEMIIYNQLERYYKSQIARIKYNKQSF